MIVDDNGLSSPSIATDQKAFKSSTGGSTHGCRHSSQARPAPWPPLPYAIDCDLAAAGGFHKRGVPLVIIHL